MKARQHFALGRLLTHEIVGAHLQGEDALKGLARPSDNEQGRGIQIRHPTYGSQSGRIRKAGDQHDRVKAFCFRPVGCDPPRQRRVVNGKALLIEVDRQIAVVAIT